MKVVLLGGTKGIGRALARLIAEKGHSICLLGREKEDMERSAADVHVRAGTNAVSIAYCDLALPETFGPALDRAAAELDGFDCVVVTAGAFAPQERLEVDRELTREVLTNNFAHTVLFCEEARERLLARGGGTLAVLSSVAGERGRKPVVLYGASKAGLTAYLEGLDHRFRSRGLKTVTVKPGFVKTGMTAGLPVPPFAGDPEGVAKDILRAIERGSPVVYTPGAWRWVMLAIRNLPRFVMRRIQI